MWLAISDDGWINEQIKARWYTMMCDTEISPFSPFADKGVRKVMQSDQHYSNLTLEQVEMQLHTNAAAVFTPGHHTAVLQQAD